MLLIIFTTERKESHIPVIEIPVILSSHREGDDRWYWYLI